MNSKLYVPDPNQWKTYFEKKPADTLKEDNSTIKLTSPVQSVVQSLMRICIQHISVLYHRNTLR